MKLSNVVIFVCAIALLIVFASCQKGSVEPVSIDANDMCSFCRMTISEKRYASELIDDDGNAFKFDDIGCMANFIKQKENNAQFAASFVVDFESGEWLDAENAFYVRSPEFKTPMYGGIVAFKDRSSAQAAVEKYHGAIISFADLTR